MRQIPHIGITVIAAILIAAGHVGAAQNAEESAQNRPDFSGHWVLDQSGSSTVGGGEGDKNGVASGGGGRRGGGLGLGAPIGEVTIRQNATSLTVDEQRGARTLQTTYRFDRRKVTNTMWVGNITRGRATTAVFTSRWDGAQLVTTMSVKLPDTPNVGTFKEVRSLDASGRMVVELTADGKPGNRKAVYRR